MQIGRRWKVVQPDSQPSPGFFQAAPAYEGRVRVTQ